MAHAISIDDRETRATPNERLEALKARSVPTQDNQQQLGDGDLNKVMDHDLYKATKEGDVEKFIDALERVSESRKLALSLIFDQVTPFGNSLLHVAASSEKEGVVELILIHFPYLVTRKNSLEDTPLHVAIQDRRLKATEKIIRLGIDSEIMYWKNKDSKSALYLAAETRDMKILQLLLESFARDEAYAVKISGMSPVFAAFQMSNLDILEEIIDRLPKLLHLPDENGRTPLHFAASVGNLEAVRLLLRKCPGLTLHTDKNGSYPIHIACERGNFSILCELVGTWPDLTEIKNNKGQNVLHMAAMGGNKNMVRHILKECGEPDIRKLVNAKDVDGNTPLHLASLHSNCQVLLSLTKDTNTDLHVLNNERLSALDVVVVHGNRPSKNSGFLGLAILTNAGIKQNDDAVRSLLEKDPMKIQFICNWFKDEIGTRLLVATLVASVTFSAGITLPSGYDASSDPHPGTVTMLHKGLFQLFLIANMLAMYSSILAVVVLLWCRYADFYVARLAYNLAGSLLLTALPSMAVAFLAALIGAVSKLTWLTSVVLVIAVLFVGMLVMVFAALLFPFSTIATVIVFLYDQVLGLADLKSKFVTMYRGIFLNKDRARNNP